MNWYWWRHRLGRDHARAWRHREEGSTPRPRVLLESPDGAEAHAVWSLLDRHGYETMWCPGPSGRHVRECSLVRTDRCPLVDGADVVVSALDQSDGRCAEVARHLDGAARGHLRPRSVVVVTPKSAAEELAVALPHCYVVPGPLSSETVLHAVTGVPPQRNEATAARPA